MRTSDNQTPIVKSADRVLDIFELFATQADSLSLTDIARKLEMPTSSTYKILQNLLERGYLEADKQGKMFRLGYKIFEVGAKYMQSSNLTSEFYRFAQQVVEEINETVYLLIRDGNKILYIAEKQNSHPLRFVSHLGMKLPLHATASGKVLLSKLSLEEIKEIYPNEDLGMFTEKTIPHLTQLINELGKIRADGIAYNYGEAINGVYCIAGPVYNAEETVVAAISISIPTTRITQELWQKAVNWVEQGSKELSYKLFFQNQ
jgi:DNA-binding IclR family transcriptional regulator